MKIFKRGLIEYAVADLNDFLRAIGKKPADFPMNVYSYKPAARKMGKRFWKRQERRAQRRDW